MRPISIGRTLSVSCPIKYSVRGRDLGSTVADAQARIAKNVQLKEGYRLEWSGEFGALVEAKKRLAIIIPLSLVLIMMLLYSLFNSVRDSLLALSGIPFAACGGILGLYLFGLNASVSAAVGFISLFGVSAMDGILLVSYIRRRLDEGFGKEEAIIGAAQARMRQIFMTGFSACIGLVPAAISTGIGSQVQQPLACVIVGGMLLSPICSLLVIPTLARLVDADRATDGAGRSRTAPPSRDPRNRNCGSACPLGRLHSSPTRPTALLITGQNSRTNASVVIEPTRRSTRRRADRRRHRSSPAGTRLPRGCRAQARA